MLELALIVIACLAGTYSAGIIVDISYRLMRITELKVDHDNTRNKDTKNECLNLTRHHMGGIKNSWKWPLVVVSSIVDAIKWGSSLGVK